MDNNCDTWFITENDALENISTNNFEYKSIIRTKEEILEDINIYEK